MTGRTESSELRLMERAKQAETFEEWRSIVAEMETDGAAIVRMLFAYPGFAERMVANAEPNELERYQSLQAAANRGRDLATPDEIREARRETDEELGREAERSRFYETLNVLEDSFTRWVYRPLLDVSQKRLLLRVGFGRDDQAYAFHKTIPQILSLATSMAGWCNDALEELKESGIEVAKFISASEVSEQLGRLQTKVADLEKRLEGSDESDSETVQAEEEPTPVHET